VGCDADPEAPRRGNLGVKAEDSSRQEARADKWEGLMEARRIAITPRPFRGEDEDEVVEIAEVSRNVL